MTWSAEQSGSLIYQSQAIGLFSGQGAELDQITLAIQYSQIKELKIFGDPKVSQVTNSDGTRQWMMTLAVLDRISFIPPLIWSIGPLKVSLGLGIGASWRSLGMSRFASFYESRRIPEMGSLGQH